MSAPFEAFQFIGVPGEPKKVDFERRAIVECIELVGRLQRRADADFFNEKVRFKNAHNRVNIGIAVLNDKINFVGRPRDAQ